MVRLAHALAAASRYSQQMHTMMQVPDGGLSGLSDTLDHARARSFGPMRRTMKVPTQTTAPTLAPTPTPTQLQPTHPPHLIQLTTSHPSHLKSPQTHLPTNPTSPLPAPQPPTHLSTHPSAHTHPPYQLPPHSPPPTHLLAPARPPAQPIYGRCQPCRRLLCYESTTIAA